MTGRTLLLASLISLLVPHAASAKASTNGLAGQTLSVLTNEAVKHIKPLLNNGETIVSTQWGVKGSKAANPKQALVITTAPAIPKWGYGRITETQIVRKKKRTQVVQTVYSRSLSANGTVTVSIERFTHNSSRIVNIEKRNSGKTVATLCSANHCVSFTGVIPNGYTATDDLWQFNTQSGSLGYINTEELWRLSHGALSGAKIYHGTLVGNPGKPGTQISQGTSIQQLVSTGFAVTAEDIAQGTSGIADSELVALEALNPFNQNLIEIKIPTLVNLNKSGISKGLHDTAMAITK